MEIHQVQKVRCHLCFKNIIVERTQQLCHYNSISTATIIIISTMPTITSRTEAAIEGYFYAKLFD